jgi:hypothetical protein
LSFGGNALLDGTGLAEVHFGALAVADFGQVYGCFGFFTSLAQHNL